MTRTEARPRFAARTINASNLTGSLGDCGGHAVYRASTKGKPARIAERLGEEIEFGDWFAVFRLRPLSGDLVGGADWSGRSRLTPIAELRRLRTYGNEVG